MKPDIFVEKLIFNDGTEVPVNPSDIVIFTGANNAGKSQVLKDIDTILTQRTKGVVVTSMSINYVGDISEQQDEYKQKDGKYRVLNVIFHTPENMVNAWKAQDTIFVKGFIKRLSTEQRLETSKTAPSFNRQNDKPTHPVHHLYIDENLQEKISSLFHEAFDQFLIVNYGGGNNIPIHVGQNPTKEAGEDRVSSGYLEKLYKIPVLQNQGDGMRSFAGILFDVFTTDKSVTMIDEPEAFLHPPQARLLGRMLVSNKQKDRQLFISTHSEDFLKGLLDADSSNVKIIRIDRKENVNHIKLLDNEDLKSLWKDSILRYSNILSGLFHSKVVICESDTDCRFYQAVLNAICEGKRIANPDILFTYCGGKERFKVVIPALKALNVNTVVIPDIDVLNKEDTFKPICEAMNISWDEIGAMFKEVTAYVNSQRPQLDAEEARKEILQIFDRIKTPQMSKEDIDAVKKKLKASSAWGKVKEVGKSFFKGDPYTKLDNLLNKCKEKGLFIVPVGELESFYKPEANKHGSAWVNAVMPLDLANEKELEEARTFVNEIAEYK